MRLLPKPASAEVSFLHPSQTFAVKPVNLIADVLNTEAVDFHRSKGHTTDKYFVHVSDLMQVNSTRRFCPRQHVLSLVEGRFASNYRKIPPGMHMLHAIGHAVQAHITNLFISRSADRDKVWGDWACVCGHTTRAYSFKPKPGADTCTKCGTDPTIYKEISITWKEYNVSGHPDLCIVWNNVLHIHEIKTIDRQGVNFETMDAPLGDHTLQGSMYYHVMKAMVKKERDTLAMYPSAFPPSMPFEIDPFVTYIYADRSNKNLFKRSFYKEFTKRASSFERIEPLLHNAKVLKESLDKRILPTRLSVCQGPNSPRAKQCNCVIACFNRNKDRLDARV